MKTGLAWFMAVGMLASVSGCGSNTTPGSQSDSLDTSQAREVDFGCATCIYKMEGVSGCVLAVEIDDKHYLVDGVDIDDLGDAHAADGLCLIERQGTITGSIEGDRFVATAASLHPLTTEDNEDHDASNQHQH